MLNARIRKVFAQKKVPIYSIGNPGDLTYDYTIIGNKTDDIKKILNNESNFSKILSSSKKPVIIIGESALELKSGKYLIEGFKNLHSNPKSPRLNFYHHGSPVQGDLPRIPGYGQDLDHQPIHQLDLR